MEPTLIEIPPCAEQAVACTVVGFGMVSASAERIAELRRNPAPHAEEQLSPSFLKHADEQTVVGLAAVYQAIHHHLKGTNFAQWGVIAAPSLLGRLAVVRSLQRFTAEGAWGISPHLIPHHSLHALSGTTSQALKIYGPNFGIGGAPEATIEAFQVAASLLAGHDLPGLWVIVTENDPESLPFDPRQNANNPPGPTPICLALALALVPGGARGAGMTLRICPGGQPSGKSKEPAWTSWQQLTCVRDLMAAFSRDEAVTGEWRLGTTGWIKLENRATFSEKRK